MQVRYDAAILGAGADGLAAAATLARKGLKTIVIEGRDRPGGLCATTEFHPGFHASPYTDEIPAIPLPVHWTFDLFRRGAIFVPAPQSVAIWPDRRHLLSDATTSPAMSLLRKAANLRADAIARARQHIVRRHRRIFSFARRPVAGPWPGQTWTTLSLSALLAREVGDEATGAHLAAFALDGRPADPFLTGSALHFLAPGGGGSGVVVGGLGRFAAALARTAADAGAEINCGLNASDLKLDNDRIAAVGLADGTELEVRAVISTLDLKRTFLSLCAWKSLSQPLVANVGQYRMAGATARVLFALKSATRPSSLELPRGAVYVAPALSQFAEASLAWRSGSIAKELPVTLRLVSALDPGLAPDGCAVMTATLGAVPLRLFDGAWTAEKRDILRDRALEAAELAFPGTADRVLAATVLTPGDMDEALGATGGDLWGGEIASDQMLDFRPWTRPGTPRTPIRGLYLAGPSSPLGPITTCAAGILAAEAVMSDFESARKR